MVQQEPVTVQQHKQFGLGKITLLTVQLKPVTVQQDLRLPTDSSARFKTTNR